MCGIAGILGRVATRPEAVRVMTDRMAHRGPDDAGLWQSADGRVVLGHRRLSILDTSAAGHQPMERGDLVLVFNGEIYNYLELRAELQAAGAAFGTGSDTEVVLAAHEAWGDDAPARFNGMFAYALLDRRRNRLVACRDRFGEKPFLFAPVDRFFAFASEYKALLALEGIARDHAEGPLMDFLDGMNQGADDARATLFPAIRQLLPGERMVVELDDLSWRVDRYWTLTVDPALAGLGMDEAAARFRDLLTDSVRLRMRSDVPVGSCLSGGLDSSAIVCLARRLLGDDAPYHVFTGRFPGTRSDEWDHARQVIDATGVIPHVVEPTADGFERDLAAFVWANELPVGSTSQYAQYCVFRLARENGVTVLLDGQGADEVLGGYEQYFARYLASLPPAERPAEEARIRARYPKALLAPAQSALTRLPDRLRWLLATATGKGSDPRFGFAFRHAVRPSAGATLDDGLAPLPTTLARDSFQAHLPVLLRYGDRNSMAHSREVRLPFCDHRIAEFALSLDPRLLMGEAQTKRLLREAMTGILPEPIRTRWNKQGFLPPQDLWFKAGLLDRAEAMVNDPAFAASGLWNPRWWRSAVRRLRQGEGQLAFILWRPVIAQAWLDHFVAPIKAQAPVPVRAP